MQAVAGGFLEFAHEMVAAQEDLCSQTFNREIFFQMTADIAEYLLDLGVVRDAFLCLQFMVFQAAVKKDQEFHKDDFCIQPIGKALPVGCFFNFIHVEEQVMALSGQLMHDTACVLRQFEAGGEIGAMGLS